MFSCGWFLRRCLHSILHVFLPPRRFTHYSRSSQYLAFSSAAHIRTYFSSRLPCHRFVHVTPTPSFFPRTLLTIPPNHHFFLVHFLIPLLQISTIISNVSLVLTSTLRPSPSIRNRDFRIFECLLERRNDYRNPLQYRTRGRIVGMSKAKGKSIFSLINHPDPSSQIVEEPLARQLVWT